MADISGKDLAYRALASALGGPVDLTAMVMKPFGYNVEKPVLGSEWIGQKMEQGGIVSSARDPLKEFGASVMVPSPGGLAAGIGKGAALLPAIVGMTKVGKADDALLGVEKIAVKAKYGDVTGRKVFSSPATEFDIQPTSKKTIKMYKAQIKAGEYVEPPIVDITDKSVILDGNHRAAAYKELGLPVPWVYGSYSDTNPFRVGEPMSDEAIAAILRAESTK